MKVIWTNDAKLDYLETIEYLVKDWSQKSASKFIEEVESVIDLLKTHPKLFPLSGYKSVRRAVVRKQITLYYQYVDEKIYLIRIWNTFKDPNSLKF